MNIKKSYCTNCKKCDHNSKECIEPIYSYGIICIKIDDTIVPSPIFIQNYLINKIIDIDNFNLLNLSNLNIIDYYKDKIKFLVIQRKHSFSYVEFIRGRYEKNDLKSFQYLLNLMSKTEIEQIIINEFKTLWNELWQKTSKHIAFQKEFETSQKKFNYIKKNFNLLELINFKNLYDTPEWGFPKGRRNSNEKNLNCAIREFIEETNINSNYFHILERLNYVTEEYIGTNLVNYCHIYYLASTNNEIELDINKNQLEEISDIKWFTIPEAINKIRPYYKKRIHLIHQIYFFLINLVIDMNKINKQIINI